jgi:ATP-binding cassette, subfamily C (CFTR/MRP), member 1
MPGVTCIKLRTPRLLLLLQPHYLPILTRRNMRVTNLTCSDASLRACGDDFDFTLTFEYYFFSILPSVVFLCFSPIRLHRLWRQSAKVDGINFKYLKLVRKIYYTLCQPAEASIAKAAISVFASLQLTLIVLWATQPGLSTKLPPLLATIISFVASLVLLPVSLFEHGRSLRPSMLLSAYLFVTLLLDAATLRTIWLSSLNISLKCVFSMSWSLKFVLVILEGMKKTRFFKGDQSACGPEESSGLYEEGLLWWLNQILLLGSRKILRPADLYPLTSDMSTETSSNMFWQSWHKGMLSLNCGLRGV